MSLVYLISLLNMLIFLKPQIFNDICIGRICWSECQGYRMWTVYLKYSQKHRRISSLMWRKRIVGIYVAGEGSSI